MLTFVIEVPSNEILSTIPKWDLQDMLCIIITERVSD
jgi:hypothetical protein